MTIADRRHAAGRSAGASNANLTKAGGWVVLVFAVLAW